MTAGDTRNSGRQDTDVSRLGEPNLLFRNGGADDRGIPSFTEVGGEAGVREPLVSFPTWFWDYNNSGFLDLLMFGYEMERDAVAAEYLGREVRATMPRLYENNGDGTFTDVTAERGKLRRQHPPGRDRTRPGRGHPGDTSLLARFRRAPGVSGRGAQPDLPGAGGLRRPGKGGCPYLFLPARSAGAPP